MRQHSGTLASNDLYVNLLQSFDIHLRARNRSERTNETYIDSTTQFLEFAIDRDLPSQPTQWTRSHVGGFMAFLMEERGLKSSTANNRYRGLQAFFRWLEDEGDIPYSPMGEYTNSKGFKVRRMQPPKIDTTPPEVLKADDLEKLLGTCLKGKTDVDRRDAAIISLFIDTGCRLAELSNLTVDDVDVINNLVWVVGKGNIPRPLRIGAKCAQDINRYLRVRKQRGWGPDTKALWLGSGGRQSKTPAMTFSGIRRVIYRRAAQANLGKVYPHQLRHSWAHDQMASHELSDGEIMQLAGWKSRVMLQRYAASAAQERALEAAKRNSLRDRL